MLNFPLDTVTHFWLTSIVNYEQVEQDAKKRLQELASEREAIDREMQAIARIIEGAHLASQPEEPLIATLTNAERTPEPEQLGVTDAVRLVLARAQVPLLPTEIRDALESMGIEASSPKVLIIHVHNVLRRLFEAGEIKQVPRDGKMGYRTETLADAMARVMNPIGSFLSTPLTSKASTKTPLGMHAEFLSKQRAKRLIDDIHEADKKK